MPKCPKCKVDMRKVGKDSPFYVPLPPGMELYQCPRCQQLYICAGGSCEEYSFELYKAIIDLYEKQVVGKEKQARKKREKRSIITSLAEQRRQELTQQPVGQASPETPRLPVEQETSKEVEETLKKPIWATLPRETLERYAKEWAMRRVETCPRCGRRMDIWYVQVLPALGYFVVYWYCPKCLIGQKKRYSLDILFERR